MVLKQRAIILYFVVLSVLKLSKSDTPVTPPETNVLELEQHEVYSYNSKNSSSIYHSCNAYLREFAKQTSEFINCAILNSRPFRLCETCATSYKKTVTVYNDIKQDDGRFSQCQGLLLYADIVEVLSRTSTFIKQIWKNSYCDACFKTLDEDANGTVHTQLSDDVTKFIRLYYDTLDCFRVNRTGVWSLHLFQPLFNESVCVVCWPQYKALGNFFQKLEVCASCDICMDLVDLMNYTRLKWSDDLNCSHRSSDQNTVIALTVIFGLVPIVFYVGIRIHGEGPTLRIVRQKRMRRHNQLRDSQMNLANSDAELDHDIASPGSSGCERCDYGAVGATGRC